jgi:hypothetical protein
MKTIVIPEQKINVYPFAELSEDAQKNVLNYLWDINVDYEWWESTYDDAENSGLKLESFNLDRNKHATGKFTESAFECADLIIKNHGTSCETHKTSVQFHKDRDALVEKYSDGVSKDRVAEGKEYDFDEECDDLETEFISSLLEDYANILQTEYEYLTSKEAIIKTINANEYTFEEDGTMRNA